MTVGRARSVRSQRRVAVLVGVAVLAGVHRRRHRRAVAGRRADRHRACPIPGPVTTLRPAVRAGGGRDRRRRGGRVVPVRGVPGAAAAQRGARRRRLPRAAARHGRVGGVDGVRGAAGAADRLRRLRPAADATTSTRSAIWSVASLVDTAAAWRWTAFLAAVVTLASLPVLRWSWTPVLFAGSLMTLMPLGLTGHSSAGGSHDLATNSLLIHLIAARAVGGWPAGAAGPRAARRRSTPTWPRGGSRAVALWCFVAMARQRRGQRAGADPAGGPVRHRLRLAGRRQVRRAVRAGRHRLAPAAQRSRCAARPIRKLAGR